MSVSSNSTLEILQLAINLIFSLWWVYLAAILIVIFKVSWMYYINIKYVSALKWVLLEIQIPKEEGLGPKAAEQIFAGLGGSGSKGNVLDRYIKGKVPDWFSFEIVGVNGGIHFFIRTIEKNRNLTESLVYAQYPTAMIQEVEDYAAKIPKNVPLKNCDVAGTDLILAADQCYPIRTYPFFEDSYTKEMVDPLSSISEFFTKLKEGELLGIQILIRASTEEWKEKADETVAKLISKKVPPKPKTGWEDSRARAAWEFKDFGRMLFQGLMLNQAESEPYPGDKKVEDAGQSLIQHLSPGGKEQVAAIEMKSSKIGFDTRIRILYYAKKDVFAVANGAAPIGIFKQFAVQNLNSFKPDPATAVSKPDYLFKNFRKTYRKRILVDRYISRDIFDMPAYILNIEELATLFHFPGIAVKAPMLPRIEAKRAEPPMTLPI